MPRIAPIAKEDAAPKAQELMAAVEGTMGRVPNIFATFAHSPAVFEMYLGMKKTLSGGKLTAAEQEAIALVVAAENGCSYCAAAHTAGGKRAGVDDAELSLNLRGQSGDARTQALISLAEAIVQKRGWLDDEEIEAARAAGLDDVDIVETIAVTAMNIFTNYFNHIAETEVDLPKVDLPQKAAAE